ncbi:MAG: zf-HC2 domain-containing protein [Firmicutes bacterium]|nr:zf-HC2 domain-containing protein [Bacillota bacterium]
MRTTDIWQHRCPDEGQWMAFYDGEGTARDREAMGAHLRSCTDCQRLLEEIGEAAVFGDLFLDYAYVGGHRRSRRQPPRWFPVAAAATLVLAIGAGFYHVGHRAMAAIGSLFQVKSIGAVPVTPEQLARLTRAVTDGGRLTLKYYGSIDVAGPRQAKPVPLAALPRYGMPNLWPRALGPVKAASVETGLRVTLTLNVPHINQLIESQGGRDLFPARLNYQPFTLVVPAAAIIRHDGWTLEEVPQPLVVAPGRVPVGRITKALENLPFLPPSLQTVVAQLANWKNTLIVPLPGHPENVAVAGTHGIVDSNAKGTTIGEAWVTNGMVVAVLEHATTPINRTAFEREVARLFS